MSRQPRMSRRTLEQWLSEYSVSHQNLINKKFIGYAFPLSLLAYLGWGCRCRYGLPWC